MAKNDLLNVQKKVGITYEYFTPNMRILGNVKLNDFYKNDTTYYVSVVCYIKGSDNPKKIMEAGDYSTFQEAEDVLVDFIESNFTLESLD